MSPRLSKALGSALAATLVMALVLYAVDALAEPAFWAWLPVAALIGFASQYYLWGREE